MSDKLANLLCFGDCELDLASREFRRAGELVSIEPRVFALLVFLFEQRHRAVDKDEIQDVVWKSAIVSETAVSRAIMKARRAVGDSSEKQAFIRTVHGHGYQFVATLKEEAPAAAAIKAPIATPRLFAFVIAAVLITFIFWLWPAPTPEHAIRLAVLPVENASGDAELDWTRLGLMGFANDIVEQSEGLNVVPAAEVMRFDEQRDGDDMATDFSRFRDLFGASHMLLTRLDKNASVLRLSYTLYKPNAEVERGTMVGGEPTEMMRGMIRSVAAALGYRGGGVDEITVISKDPFISEAYSRGLGLALEGRCGEALQLFDVVIAAGDSDGRAEYERATCARVLGQWQDAEAGFTAILATVPEEPATSLRAEALNGLGTVYIRTGRNDQARDTLTLGLDVARDAGDFRLQGMLLISLAIDAKNRREHAEARTLLHRASLAYSESGSGVLPGQVPAALANVDMAEGKLDLAEEHLDEALAAFRALGDRRNEAMMLNNYGYLRRLQGRMDDAAPLHLQSLDIRREIGDRVGQGRILGMLSTVYANNDRLEDARAAATEAYEIASEANDKLFMATSLAQLADVDARQGEIDASRESYLQSGALFDEIGDYSRFAQVAIRLAMLDRDTGNFASAQAMADEVLQLSFQEGLQEPAIDAMELQGDIARELSDTASSIAAYQQAFKHIEDTGFVSRKIRIVRKLANAHLDVENLAAVEPLIGIMIEEGEMTESLILRARYASLKGDSEHALALMESAKEEAAQDWSESSEEVLAGYRVN